MRNLWVTRFAGKSTPSYSAAPDIEVARLIALDKAVILAKKCYVEASADWH